MKYPQQWNDLYKWRFSLSFNVPKVSPQSSFYQIGFVSEIDFPVVAVVLPDGPHRHVHGPIRRLDAIRCVPIAILICIQSFFVPSALLPQSHLVCFWVCSQGREAADRRGRHGSEVLLSSESQLLHWNRSTLSLRPDDCDLASRFADGVDVRAHVRRRLRSVHQRQRGVCSADSRSPIQIVLTLLNCFLFLLCAEQRDRRDQRPGLEHVHCHQGEFP